MLQQTQVARVIPKFEAFLASMPTVAALARAPLADVLRLWSGLGYNSRARRLWEAARAVVLEHAGRVPQDVSVLRTLPGIGRYTAAAIASFAYGAREPVVDVNVRRVLSRALGGRDRLPEATVWRSAASALPRSRSAEWSQALMDVGAIFCRPIPNCAECPARSACKFAENGRPKRASHAPRRTGATSTASYVGSRRYFRGRIVRALTLAPRLSLLALGEQVKPDFAATDVPWLRELLADLERDGLVAMDASRGRVSLP